MSTDPEVTAIAAVCAALEPLDSEGARQRVIDFAISKFNLSQSSRKSTGLSTEVGGGGNELADLMGKFDHTKPASNVSLLTAYHYSTCGVQPFSTGELKAMADAAGLTVPARIDMTLNSAGKAGKRFFQKLGGGRYRVTVHGETFLKATYGVKKGTARTTGTEQ